MIVRPTRAHPGNDLYCEAGWPISYGSSWRKVDYLIDRDFIGRSELKLRHDGLERELKNFN